MKNSVLRLNCRQDCRGTKGDYHHSTATRLNHWFSHPWQGIERVKGKWYSFPKKYFLTPQEIFSRHQNGDRIIGLRFGHRTNYFVLDIDAGSAYHPDQDEKAFQGILGSLEDIGINKAIAITSSNSGGLHVYGFLPADVPTFGLAVALVSCLSNAGYEIKGGQLETFPNVKKYADDGQFSNYNGHRLPLQPGTGSYLLNSDLQPYSDDLATFLDLADSTAQEQDILTLADYITTARKEFKARQYFGPKSPTSRDGLSNVAKAWQKSLEDAIAEGWTAQHQTNDLIKLMVIHAKVFLGLSGELLRSTVIETAIAAPGFHSYCRHQRDIAKRVNDWCKSTESNLYYLPYCQFPERLGGKVTKPKGLTNEEKKLDAMERIADAYRCLLESDALPIGVNARRNAIAHLAKSSERTLIKPDYLPLWHPDHDADEKSCPNPDTAIDRATSDKAGSHPPMKLSCFPGLPSQENIFNSHDVLARCGSATSETPQSQTHREIQPFQVIMNVPKQLKPGDWVVEPDRPHILLRLESVDQDGEWCRCQDARERQRGLRGSLYFLPELIRAPMAIADDTTTPPEEQT